MCVEINFGDGGSGQFSQNEEQEDRNIFEFKYRSLF